MTREAVIAEARSWLGTPYHHHAQVKGVGVDCGQLLIGVYGAAGVLVRHPVYDYAHDWHLHRTEELFVAHVRSFGAVPTQTPKPGDIAVYKFGRCFSHGAILVEPDVVVHSYITTGVVVNNVADEPLNGREVCYFTFWKD
jgi:NlpC/P60 family putative phage cell wall peptidase